MREYIEWSNCWIEDANNKERKRILLLGDSVARDYRKSLNKIIEKEGYVVDLLAMSFGIFDELFLKEIKYFALTYDYKYQYIMYNLGSHHGYSIECKDNEAKQKEYKLKLTDIFKVLESISDNIIVISGTPENVNIEDSNNSEIEVRNHILEEFSYTCNYEYIDIYRLLYEKRFAMSDRFHYMEDGCDYIAEILKTSLKLKNECKG